MAAWLGHKDVPALEYKIDESHRPVRLRRVVLGYPDASSEFKFDLSLNYRLGGVILLYSDQKPTLVVSEVLQGVLKSEAYGCCCCCAAVLCHQEGNAARGQHTSQGGTICDERPTQAASPALC